MTCFGLLCQKLVKNLSNENINTGVSVVFKTKRELKCPNKLFFWKHQFFCFHYWEILTGFLTWWLTIHIWHSRKTLLLSLKIYTLVNNDYVVVSSQAQMTATVILLPGVLGECLAVLIVLWLLLQLSGQQILPQLATAQ